MHLYRFRHQWTCPISIGIYHYSTIRIAEGQFQQDLENKKATEKSKAKKSEASTETTKNAESFEFINEGLRCRNEHHALKGKEISHISYLAHSLR